MIIIFNTDKLQHIPEISFYNHNHYKLPYTIDGCDILYYECEEDTNSHEFYLGKIEGEYFVTNLWFYGDECEEVDTMKNKLDMDGPIRMKLFFAG